MDNLNQNAPDQELDNAFGITAPEGNQQQGESQQTGQLDNVAPNGELHNQAPETPTDDLGEQSAQEQAPSGEPAEITEEKKTNILQKFGNDRTKIAEGLVNIGKRLGKEVDMDKVSNLSNEEILIQYAEAEKELGTQGSQQQPNNEVEQVKQQMQQLAQQNQAMRMMLQQAQQSPQAQRQRDPNTGQFVPQNQQKQPQQSEDGYKTILNNMKFDDYDPDKYIEDENYHANYMQNKFSELLENMDKREQTKQEKARQMQEQEQQKQQAIKRVNGQILQIKQKMGDQNFNQSRRLAGAILQNNPHLLKFQGGVNPYTGQPEPSGVEIAFNQARQQLGISNANQQTNVSNQQQQLTQQQINTRQAAQMPRNNPRTPVQPANNQNRDILDAFGLK